jgi:hypothetical protein
MPPEIEKINTRKRVAYWFQFRYNKINGFHGCGCLSQESLPTLFKFQTGIDQKQIMDLATLGFVECKQWLILAGSSGTGKSHIAKALLLLACQKVYSCRYVTASSMLRDLLSGLANDSLDEKLKVYLRPQVLLIGYHEHSHVNIR